MYVPIGRHVLITVKGNSPVKEIIRWLETKLFRSKLVNPPIESDSTNPDRTVLDLPKDMQDLVNDTPPSANDESELEATMVDITAPNLLLD